MVEKNLKLKSGYEMPVLGLGTWQLLGKECTIIVRKAIEIGYSHIDTAELYDNEEEIGKGIREFDRDSVFITSKVSSANLARRDVLRSCDRSLSKLDTEYIDLYLIHWPNDNIPLGQTLEAMGQLVEKGKVRSIGLSNFNIDRIREAISLSAAPICNLQIEYHPLTKRYSLPEFCRLNGITVSAYSPLARGLVFSEPTIVKIASKYKKTPGQVSLRWLMQKGAAVIPKASSLDHLYENTQVFDWQLSDEDMDSIDNIKTQQRLVDTIYT